MNVTNEPVRHDATPIMNAETINYDCPNRFV